MISGNLVQKLTSQQKNGSGVWSSFSALLLLPEHGAARTAQRILHDHGIHVHSAATILEASQLMRSRRQDLIIFDSDLPWIDQLSCLAPSTNWRGVAMALSGNGHSKLNARRIHFTLPKPLSAGILMRGLKAAYTNLAQQRIATYRHNVPARVVSGTLLHRGWQRTLHHVNVLNLSQTGLCLNTPEPLPQGASLKMHLLLPEDSSSVHASGTIVWSHNNGRTGVAFDRSACPEMKKFQEHLNAWLPPELENVIRTS